MNLKTIHITMQNQTIELAAHSSIQDALDKIQQSEKIFAVALNQQFISRESYATTPLCAGDCVDIIVPMQGG